MSRAFFLKTFAASLAGGDDPPALAERIPASPNNPLPDYFLG